MIVDDEGESAYATVWIDAVPPPLRTISGQVWDDADQYGIRAGEGGLYWVTVDLYVEGGGYLNSTYTDWDGNYQFMLYAFKSDTLSHVWKL